MLSIHFWSLNSKAKKKSMQCSLQAVRVVFFIDFVRHVVILHDFNSHRRHIVVGKLTNDCFV